MNKPEMLLDFLRSQGRALVEINPGSEEFALSCDDTLSAIRVLEEMQTPILGGDFLTEDLQGKLRYAYQSWGTKYHSLNWYCNQIEGEDRVTYSARSFELARHSIEHARKIANELNQSCYVTLVF